MKLTHIHILYKSHVGIGNVWQLPGYSARVKWEKATHLLLELCCNDWVVRDEESLALHVLD